MAQRLILGINSTRITAAYKNANYRKQFGYSHYGVDMTDKARKVKTVYASGVGEVVAAGWDDIAGNCCVIIYRNCQLPYNGGNRDIVIRYFHFDKLFVKKGDRVTKDTKIGNYGNTGNSAGAHLHIECDVDILYPCHTPSISRSRQIMKRGTDTTLNPTKVLWCKTTKPDCQSVVGSTTSDCYTSADLKYLVTE